MDEIRFSWKGLQKSGSQKLSAHLPPRRTQCAAPEPCLVAAGWGDPQPTAAEMSSAVRGEVLLPGLCCLFSPMSGQLTPTSLRSLHKWHLTR